MRVTERLANLTIPQVLIIVAVLVAVRFLLPRWSKAPFAKSVAEIAESLAVAMALVFLLIRPFLIQTFYIPSASMHPTLLENDQIIVNKLIYRIKDPKPGDVIVFKAPPAATPDIQQAADMEAINRGLEGQARDEFVSSYEQSHAKDFIKRVIAVPGNMVRITPGYVLIDKVQYDRAGIRQLLSNKFTQENGDHAIRFFKDYILLEGVTKVTKPEIAALIDKPKAKIQIFPGTVYINGKAQDEPYINEDPDQPYPVTMGMRATPDIDSIVTEKGQLYIKIPKGKLLVMGDNRNDSNDARFWGLLDRDRALGKAMFVFWPLTRIKLVH